MPLVQHNSTEQSSAAVVIPGDVQPGRRAALRSFGKRAVLKALVPVGACLGARQTGSFGILMYHRTTPRIEGAPEATWNVTPDRFRQQMEGLLARGYRPTSLRQAIADHRSRQPTTDKTFVVTFDDGYENNFVFARPILEELRIPATIFVATAYLDGDRAFPSDDWALAGSSRVPSNCWRPLATDQCHEMLSGGLIDIGTHTHTHDDFRGRPEELQADLETSLATLASRFGLQDATFAFPYGTPRLGFCSPPMTRAARKAGVLCSLTTESRFVTPGCDRFGWGRLTAEQSDTAGMLAAKLDGWYSLARDAWKSMRGHSQ